MGIDLLGVQADQIDNNGHDHDNDNASASCDDNGVCHDQQTQQTQDQKEQQQHKDSKLCISLTQSNEKMASSIEHFYHQGMTAQAYKPNAPLKTNVCQVHEIISGEANPNQTHHNVAHWTSWRSSYEHVVPLIVHGNIYSCNSPQSLNSNAITMMEVWQPRPGGTYSSLRSGVEEGDCRASVPITQPDSNDNNNNNESSTNLLGQVQYETLAPGSTGILGGLVPDSSRDYPPYAPGAIHMLLNLDGYSPLLGELDVNDLEDWMLQEHSQGHFGFKGWNMGPHRSKRSHADGSGGIEIQSVKKISRPGYDLAFEVKVDIFLSPIVGNEEVEGGAEEKKASLNELFCSSNYGVFSWISSFFKEPITVCFPSLLDFFAL